MADTIKFCPNYMPKGIYKKSDKYKEMRRKLMTGNKLRLGSKNPNDNKVL